MSKEKPQTTTVPTKSETKEAARERHERWVDKMRQEKRDFSVEEFAKQCAKEWAVNSGKKERER
jgi:hypothetical protein